MPGFFTSMAVRRVSRKVKAGKQWQQVWNFVPIAVKSRALRVAASRARQNAVDAALLKVHPAAARYLREQRRWNFAAIAAKSREVKRAANRTNRNVPSATLLKALPAAANFQKYKFN